MTSFKELLLKAVTDYPEAKKTPFTSNDFTKIITSEIPQLISEKLFLDENEFRTYGSCGKGTWTEIPWAAILKKSVTTTTQSGYYVVYLFSQSTSKVFLSLALGWNQFEEEFGTKEGKEKIKEIGGTLAKKLRNVPKGFIAGSIDLGAISNRAKGYESGQIISKEYDINNLPEDKVLLNDLRSLLGTYEELIRIAGNSVLNISLEEKNIETLEEIENVIASSTLEPDTSKALLELVKFAEAKPSQVKTSIIKKIVRIPKFASFVKQRANYICEICGKEPFMQSNGKPYAEADHIKALGRGGLDHPDNMRCLCAQCHAIFTNGSDEEINKLTKI